MALNDPAPRQPEPDPLRIVNAVRPTKPADQHDEWFENALHLYFNRPPTDDEMKEIASLPPSPQILADARQYSDELVLTKLVCRFFRTIILSALIVPETPQIMDWLRDYIDGTHKVHGPLGKPMIWPDALPQTASLLREWGFQPTPTRPPYVSLKAGGILTSDAPDPVAPDPASIPPLERDLAMRMASLLDSFTQGVACMALDRQTVLRAMAEAFERGEAKANEGVNFGPILAALDQLQNHQQQASEDGALVTVSRQAIAEVVDYVAENGNATIDSIVARVTQDVAELPDRTSPEDEPEMMMVTGDELALIVRRALGEDV